MNDRNLIKFVVPVSLDSLGSFNISARAVIPFYINPEQMDIQDKKLIQKSQTKGGFSVQYWGEDLSTLSISGTTGSGGIEAAYLLRDVYRHEQLQMNKILLARLKEAKDAEESASQNSGSPPQNFYNAVDKLTGGALSQIVDGVSSVIEGLKGSYDTNNSGIEKIFLSPTPAAFATSIDMYYGGERLRGYFESFSIKENAQSPGIINYQFSFVITRRWGTRKNYMPWHRNPKDRSGHATGASLPSEGAATNELSFPTKNSTQESLTNAGLRSRRDASTRFTSDDITTDINSVPINRAKSTK